MHFTVLAINQPAIIVRSCILTTFLLSFSLSIFTVLKRYNNYCIMVLKPHHDHFRRCCEKAQHPTFQTDTSACFHIIKKKYYSNRFEQSINECNNVMINQKNKTGPIDGHNASNGSPTTNCEPIPGTFAALTWSLPPSKIYDGRLYRRVG